MEARNHDQKPRSVFILGFEGSEVFYLASEKKIVSTLAPPPAKHEWNEKTAPLKKEKASRKTL